MEGFAPHRRNVTVAPVHHEKVFEDAIESALLRAGWLKGANDLYDHALGLNPTSCLPS